MIQIYYLGNEVIENQAEDINIMKVVIIKGYLFGITEDLKKETTTIENNILVQTKIILEIEMGTNDRKRLFVKIVRNLYFY